MSTTTHPRSAVMASPPRPDAAPPLTYVGDDGQYLVAMGHVNKALMVCLAVAGWAKDCGVPETVSVFDLDSDDRPGVVLADLQGLVDHRWVIEPTVGSGCEPSVWWRHPDTMEPVTADTPGAFPVTVFNTEG